MKVRYHEVEIECASMEEAVAVAKQLAILPSPAAANGVAHALVPSRNSRFAAFRAEMSDSTKSFLAALVQNPHGITGKQLSAALGLKSPVHMGGIMSSIARAAKQHGIEVEHLWSRKRQPAENGGDLVYAPTKTLMAEMPSMPTGQAKG